MSRSPTPPTPSSAKSPTPPSGPRSLPKRTGRTPTASTFTSRATGRRPSLLSDSLFSALASTPEMTAKTSGEAWLRAILHFEGALARAQGTNGVIPREAATAISDACADLPLGPAAIAAATPLTGTPILPIVTELRRAVPAHHADYVHWGATSQDALDT